MRTIVVEIEVNDNDYDRAFPVESEIILNYDESLYTPKVYDNIIYSEVDNGDIINISRILGIRELNSELYNELYCYEYNLLATFRLPNIEKFCIDNQIAYDGVYCDVDLVYVNNSTIFDDVGQSSINSISNSNIGFPIYYALKKQDIEELYEISDKYVSFMISKDKVNGFDAVDSFTYNGNTLYLYIRYLNTVFEKLGITIVDSLDKLSKFHDEMIFNGELFNLIKDKCHKKIYNWFIGHSSDNEYGYPKYYCSKVENVLELLEMEELYRYNYIPNECEIYNCDDVLEDIKDIPELISEGNRLYDNFDESRDVKYSYSYSHIYNINSLNCEVHPELKKYIDRQFEFVATVKDITLMSLSNNKYPLSTYIVSR